MSAGRGLDIRLKRVFAAPAAEDGERILVDRLWPRGMRKEAAALDGWMKDLAPRPSSGAGSATTRRVGAGSANATRRSWRGTAISSTRFATAPASAR